MKRYLPAILSCILLVLLTITGFVIYLNSFTTNTQIQFEQLADARVAAIQRSLNDKLLILESMRAMYAVYDGQPQPQFGSFVQPYEDEIPGIQALQWIVPVPANERDNFETARQNEGITGFQIRERNAEGLMIRAGIRDMYFPIYPVLPLDTGETSIGFDLTSDPVRSAALFEAIRTGEETASARVELLQASSSMEFGFLTFAPLFSISDSPSSSLLDQELLGLVTGVFKISDIINNAVGPLDDEPISLLIEDESADENEKFLYQYQTSMDENSLSEKSGSALFSPTPYTSSFDFAGRTWSITAAPETVYMAARPATSLWTILVLGLLSSIFLTAYLVLNTRQALKFRETEIQKEQLEKQLVHSQKLQAMGRLVGGIAHDFNNILTSVLGYSELAQLHISRKNDPELEQFLQNVHKGAVRGQNLIQKLMAFSRNTPKTRSSLDLYSCVENTLELLSPIVSNRISISLTKPEDATIPQVNMDSTSLDQLLINMCINARDAITESGEIKIHVSEKNIRSGVLCNACKENITGHFVSLSITDNGHGMDEDTKEKIFQPFFTTKDVGKGTGMGLSIVNTILHNNDGHIIVMSEKGTGTTFELLISVEAP